MGRRKALDDGHQIELDDGHQVELDDFLDDLVTLADVDPWTFPW